MKCKYCKNYIQDLDTCKFCEFVFNEEYSPYLDDDWDIFSLDEENGDWLHLQIFDRLRLKGIDCYYADIWFDNNMAFLYGCRTEASIIAQALNIHEDAVYIQHECDLAILNLYQEKCIRKMEAGEWD